MTSGTTQVYQGICWIARNNDAWKELQRICLQLEEMRLPDGRHKYNHLTRDGVYMLAQLEGLEITNDRAFKRDHDLWSTLVRFLIQIHPQLSRVFVLRRCFVDDYIERFGLPQLTETFIYRGDAA